jgi:hypothetical protein
MRLPAGHIKKRRSDYKPRPLCRCGCGQSVQRAENIWAPGHQQYPSRRPWLAGRPTGRKKPRPPCACGCGQPVRLPHQCYRKGHWAASHRAFLAARSVSIGPESRTWAGGLQSNHDRGDRIWVARRTYARVYAREVLECHPDAMLARVDARQPFCPPNVFVAPRYDRYSKLVQRRARAYYATGQPDWRLCYACGTWDAPSKLQHRKTKQRSGVCESTWHRECVNLAAHLRSSRLHLVKGMKYRCAALEWAREQEVRREQGCERRRIREARARTGYGKFLQTKCN